MGKRLYCANRHGRQGCGATLRLYLAERLPRLHYGAVALQTFALELMAGAAISTAYVAATGAASPRHAWRWLGKLHAGLGRLRTRLPGPDAHPLTPFAARVHRLRLLLPTLDALRGRLGATFVAAFQLQQQAAFLP